MIAAQNGGTKIFSKNLQMPLHKTSGSKIQPKSLYPASFLWSMCFCFLCRKRTWPSKMVGQWCFWKKRTNAFPDTLRAKKFGQYCSISHGFWNIKDFSFSLCRISRWISRQRFILKKKTGRCSLHISSGSKIWPKSLAPFLRYIFLCFYTAKHGGRMIFLWKCTYDSVTAFCVKNLTKITPPHTVSEIKGFFIVIVKKHCSI